MCCLSAFLAGIGIRVTVGGGVGEEGGNCYKFKGKGRGVGKGNLMAKRFYVI